MSIKVVKKWNQGNGRYVASNLDVVVVEAVVVGGMRSLLEICDRMRAAHGGRQPVSWEVVRQCVARLVRQQVLNRDRKQSATNHWYWFITPGPRLAERYPDYGQVPPGA